MGPGGKVQGGGQGEISHKCKVGLHPGGSVHVFGDRGSCKHRVIHPQERSWTTPLVEFRGERQGWHWFGPVLESGGRVLRRGDVSSKAVEGGLGASSLGG